jgi:hypothetical protein
MFVCASDSDAHKAMPQTELQYTALDIHMLDRFFRKGRNKEHIMCTGITSQNDCVPRASSPKIGNYVYGLPRRHEAHCFPYSFLKDAQEHIGKGASFSWLTTDDILT